MSNLYSSPKKQARPLQPSFSNSESSDDERSNRQGQISSPVKKARGRPRKYPSSGEEQNIPTPAKRPRGRPRKSETAPRLSATTDDEERAESLVKPTSLGRPRKSDAAPGRKSDWTTTDEEGNGRDESLVKRGRGRPRKSDAKIPSSTSADEKQLKRPRGRPRKSDSQKNLHENDVTSDDGQNQEVSSAKRPRGRPRKSAPVNPTVNPTSAKRGRGRPRKSDVPHSLNPLPTHGQKGG